MIREHEMEKHTHIIKRTLPKGLAPPLPVLSQNR